MSDVPTAELWRQSMDDKLAAFRSLIEARLESVGKDLRNLRELFEERFAHTQMQLSQLETMIKSEKGNATAVAATAIASLKELTAQQNAANTAAIAKSETAIANELAGLDRAISSAKDALIMEITNLKQRADRQEGVSTGATQAHKDAQSSVSSVVGVAGGITGFASVALILFGLLHNGTPTDTKRVDDLIAQTLSQEHDMSARLDQLSARIAVIVDNVRATPTPHPAPPP